MCAEFAEVDSLDIREVNVMFLIQIDLEHAIRVHKYILNFIKKRNSLWELNSLMFRDETIVEPY